MSEGISAVLTFAVGVAISPIPIIAVILMLFSARARVNGPVFLIGWAIALAVVVALAYVLAGAAASTTEETTEDTIAWGQLVLGALLLLLAGRQWRSRPAPGVTPPMPKLMSGIDAFTPGRAFGLALLLAGVNPKNLLLSIGAGSALAGLALSTSEAVVSMLVYVLIGSITILVPVVYYLVGGDKAKASLDSLKDWLAVNNAAVMAVLFLLFGVKLIGDALPGLGS
jgi:hypothetical protein